MSAGLVIGLAGFLVAVGATVLADIRVRQTRHNLEDLPSEVALTVAKLSFVIPQPRGEAQVTRNPLNAYAGYADLDGDGEPEMLLQHPAGVHGMSLKVFGWRFPRGFDQIAETGSGTPTSTRVEDIDGDGRLEVGTVQCDWRSGRSYLDAPVVEVFYRLNGEVFEEVGRGALWEDRTTPAPSEIAKYYAPPHWGR